MTASSPSSDDDYAGDLKAVLPANRAEAPSCRSIRNNWLNLATRSLRQPEPVLRCPAPTATVRSAIVVSSVSPERCEMKQL